MEYLNWFNDLQNNFQYVPGQTWGSTYETCYIMGAVYLAVIFTGRFLMGFREKRFEARLLSIIHNFIMFVISLVCLVGIFYGVFLNFKTNSTAEVMEILFCDQKPTLGGKGPMYFWMYIFYLTKFYELFDTVLIVLRKSELRFLHVYHHWITAMLCLLSLNNFIPYQWVATGLNAAVHVPMYWYYLMAVLKVPVWWKKYITTMQIIQFVLDMSAFAFSGFWNFVWVAAGTTCSSWNVWWANPAGSSIVFSYLLLFLNFYSKTYTAKRTGATAKAETAKKNE